MDPGADSFHRFVRRPAKRIHRVDLHILDFNVLYTNNQTNALQMVASDAPKEGASVRSSMNQNSAQKLFRRGLHSELGLA